LALLRCLGTNCRRNVASVAEFIQTRQEFGNQDERQEHHLQGNRVKRTRQWNVPEGSTVGAIVAGVVAIVNSICHAAVEIIRYLHAAK
jgi:hypothetical protein